MQKLEVHSVERSYLRQRCFDASKPRVAASTVAQYQYVKFSRHNKIVRCSAYDSKPHIAAATGVQYGFSRRNKIPRCSAYDSKPRIAAATGARYGCSRCNKILRCRAYAMEESNPGSKVDQFVHVPTPVDTQNVIEIYARVFE